jgi:hypothetical protein
MKFDTDEKVLAMCYAYTALAKSLVDTGMLNADHLLSNLDGAHKQLERIGETGAADALAAIRENLHGL